MLSWRHQLIGNAVNVIFDWGRDKSTDWKCHQSNSGVQLLENPSEIVNIAEHCSTYYTQHCTVIFHHCATVGLAPDSPLNSYKQI